MLFFSNLYPKLPFFISHWDSKKETAFDRAAGRMGEGRKPRRFEPSLISCHVSVGTAQKNILKRLDGMHIKWLWVRYHREMSCPQMRQRRLPLRDKQERENGGKAKQTNQKTHNNEHSPDWFDCITHQLSPHCLFSSLPGVPAVQSLQAEV